MHHRLLAKGSKGILLKENQSMNKRTNFIFIIIVALPLDAGGGSLSLQSKSDKALRYCICISSSFCQG
jgi:hypothetical protein